MPVFSLRHFALALIGAWVPSSLLLGGAFSMRSEVPQNGIEPSHQASPDPLETAQPCGSQAGFTLPPGSAANAIRGVNPGTEAAVIPGDLWPDWNSRDREGWGAKEPWLRWAALVRAESEALEPDPMRRAQLALCARLQGRDRDAWNHLAALADDPAAVAAVLPAFLPGARPTIGAGTRPPNGTAGCVEPGGKPGDLRSGDVLYPPLPPALDPKLTSPTSVLSAAIKVERFRVGDTDLDFSLELFDDGVEVKLHHLSGPAVDLFFVLPKPRGQTIRTVYANWERVKDPSLPVGLRLSKEQPEGEIWGRFFPRTARWPEALPAGTDERVKAGAMRLVGDPQDPFLIAMAAGLGALLETECGLVSPGTPSDGFREPLSIHLEPGPDQNSKLLGLLSTAEAYILRRTP